jgi:hypothetical protein
MDPILGEGYSPFKQIDESAWEGNGVPRPLQAIDAMLADAGMRRVMVGSAVSFLLNGPVEARGKGAFAVKQFLWNAAGVIFKHETLTRLTSPAFRAIDMALKSSGGAGSSSLCVYRRER